MRLGILLTTGAEKQDARTAVSIAEAALSQGHEVRWFVMGDGLYHLVNDPSNRLLGDLQRLLEKGAQVACCASNCSLRGIGKERLLPGVRWGSQHDHAGVVNWSDRYLVFG